MPFITAENASELGKRSGEARRNKPVSFLVPVPNNHVITEPNLARTVSELLRIVTEQIASTRALLNDEPQPIYCECPKCKTEMVLGGMPANHRAQLLKALDNLIERKTILLGIPGPGNLKPSSPKSREPRPTVQPLGYVGQAQPTTVSVQPTTPEPGAPKS